MLTHQHPTTSPKTSFKPRKISYHTPLNQLLPSDPLEQKGLPQTLPPPTPILSTSPSPSLTGGKETIATSSSASTSCFSGNLLACALIVDQHVRILFSKSSSFNAKEVSLSAAIWTEMMPEKRVSTMALACWRSLSGFGCAAMAVGIQENVTDSVKWIPRRLIYVIFVF